MALAHIHVASWRETYAGLLPDDMLAAQSVEKRAEVWEQILSQEKAFVDTHTFLAELDGEAIGFGSCGPRREDSLIQKGFGGEIQSIYVLKSCQGHGVGKSLMQRMAWELLDCGHAGLSVWVLSENAPARRFY